ncbi:cation:proton antiporter domain-containing protein [Saccharospirillum salsuginis]|uniref:Sodium:hydrogen antiporter n=1 Tax=Saccharospirillum salsuginis TaxID=418750 RepID=A0A918N9C4_9GAMM|nr:cation:proton antiporter [Saccharospirillum salsuginis]GGX51331.1 sodium:hydrogen antiporter [Saccharospirillum salsuginis]
MIFSFFLIFAGAAALATLALYFRQPLLIAYIVLGMAVGPFGTHWVENTHLLTEIAEIGIIFLLFLLGLDMQPKSLVSTLKKSSLVTIASSVLFALMGFLLVVNLGYPTREAIVIGLCLMFSSTIIGIKLLPTTVLHHKHAGELMVGILLVQDFIAILVLLILGSMASGLDAINLIRPLIALPILAALAWGAVRYIVLPLLMRFDRFQEYIFLLALGWCLGVGEAAEVMGLSYEIGAFIAGITLASSPISQFIALNLKPLRDFFLILFFFTLGARLNLNLLDEVWLSALLLAGMILTVKPILFRFLLHRFSESNHLAWDVGFRLGQISEFSLLIAFIALESNLISDRASVLLQTTAILTFAVSSYIIVLNFQNPIAIKDELRRD